MDNDSPRARKVVVRQECVRHSTTTRVNNGGNIFNIALFNGEESIMAQETFVFEVPANQRRRPQKLAEQVARRIVHVIVTNNLQPGTRLPIEADLGGQLGVGKNTLREAMRLLEAWGVVEIRQGRNGGPTVRTPRPEDLREALTIQLLFSAATLTDVFEARCGVEPQSAMMAASRMSQEDIEVLRESVIRTRDQSVSYSAFLAENQFFHEQIAASTGNVVMHAFIDTLNSLLDGSAGGIQDKPSRRLVVADAHERILNAIESRDPVRAREEMEDHLREAGGFWERSDAASNQRVSWDI